MFKHLNRWNIRGSVETKPQPGRTRKHFGHNCQETCLGFKENPQRTSTTSDCGCVAASRCKIRRHFKKNGLHGGVARRSHSWANATKHLAYNTPNRTDTSLETSGGRSFKGDETKIELLGHNHKRYFWRGVTKAYDERNTVPTVQHGGRRWSE